MIYRLNFRGNGLDRLKGLESIETDAMQACGVTTAETFLNWIKKTTIKCLDADTAAMHCDIGDDCPKSCRQRKD